VNDVRPGLEAARSICEELLGIPEEKGLRMDRKSAPGIFFPPLSAIQPSLVSRFTRVDFSDDGEACNSIAVTKSEDKRYAFRQRKVFMSVSHPTKLRKLGSSEAPTVCGVRGQRWKQLAKPVPCCLYCFLRSQQQARVKVSPSVWI